MSMPDRSWASYEQTIKNIGECREMGRQDKDAAAFLTQIGLLSEGRLTERGNAYFVSRFIKDSSDEAEKILHSSMLDHPPTAAISQLLYGVSNADKARAETVLRSQGMMQGLTDRSLGTLLTLMDRAGVIRYSKSDGLIQVLDSPLQQDSVPASVFISPRTPFGNKVWLRRILEECRDYIYWLDKHFMPVAFETLWEAADAANISTIRVLSLLMPEHEGRKAKRQYKDLVAELASRGIALEWRTIDSKDIKDTHDRWVISAVNARNIPNVGAIFSGQHSELNLSSQVAELKDLFERYWEASSPVHEAPENIEQ